MYRRNPVPVEAVGQVAEQRVIRVGGHIVDDEAVAGHAEAHRLVRLQQEGHPADEAIGRVREMGMAGWIHGTFVQNDRELHQEVR